MNPFEGGSVPDIFNGIKFHVKKGISSCHRIGVQCNVLAPIPVTRVSMAPLQFMTEVTSMTATALGKDLCLLAMLEMFFSFQCTRFDENR